MIIQQPNPTLVWKSMLRISMVKIALLLLYAFCTLSSPVMAESVASSETAGALPVILNNAERNGCNPPLEPGKTPTGTCNPSQKTIAFLGAFETIVTDRLTSFFASSDHPLMKFRDNLFRMFAAFMLIYLLMAYVFRGTSFDEILSTFLLIMMVRVLMLGYLPIVDALWEWSRDAGGLLQEVLLGTRDPYLPTALWTLVMAKMNPDVGIFSGIIVFVNTLVLMLLAAILAMLGWFASIWAFWGFTVAKLVGFMFIPMLLFDRLSFLFDGWLRFALGFLIYGILVKVNIALITLGLMWWFGLTEITSAPGTISLLGLGSLFTGDLFGMIALFLIGILSLIATGNFSTAIAGGVGGMGQSVRAVAMVAGGAMARNLMKGKK